MGDNPVKCCDVLDGLAGLPDNSIQCVVTSPPYWGLRDYQVDGQLGLESTPELYVEKMVEVFREVRRVLRPDGTLWLNLGDSYANDGKWGGTTGGKHVKKLHGEPIGRGKRETGLKPKDLCMIPARVAIALQADGWWLRSDIIWSKPNPMPESVTDRPTTAHEHIFLLTKSAKYFYDADAVREDGSIDSHGGGVVDFNKKTSMGIEGRNSGLLNAKPADGLGRNRRTVWTIATHPFPDAHFATFPLKLVEPCVMAGTSEQGACVECGAPWARVTEKTKVNEKKKQNTALPPLTGNHGTMGSDGHGHRYGSVYEVNLKTTGWSATCKCDTEETEPCTVLDPFAGSGTVGIVALNLGREFTGFELSPEYTDMANARIKRETAQMGLKF